MIPLHLTLRNFLSYREATELDLGGIHLACISGLNGAGKSTILDGITWALFGKSRVKSDDDIVNRDPGASSATAEVVFVFELEGAVYRVVRRKAVGKTGELEFHARAVESGAERWQVKTEARVRETQSEIEKLLRMNYDVFTNASFLLQGKADEFTTKTPDKRKEILADILGVNQWDDFKELATERRKATDNQVSAIERQLVEIDTELAQEEELIRALEMAEMEAKSAAAERDRQEGLVAVARSNKAMADQHREALQRLTREREGSQQELQRIEATAAQRRADLAAHQSLIDRREVIEGAYEEWQAAEAEFSRRQEKAEQHAVITREKYPVEMAIARAESQLEQRVKELEAQMSQAEAAATDHRTLQTELAAHKKRLESIQSRANELADEEKVWQEAQTRLSQIGFERELLKQEMVQLESRAAQIATLETQRVQYTTSKQAAELAVTKAESALVELGQSVEELTAKSIEKAGLESELKRLKSEMDEIKARKEQLEDDGEQDCPLCGQPLTPEHRQEMLVQLQAEGEARGSQYRRNKAAIGNLDQEIEALNKTLQKRGVIEKDLETQRAAFTRFETQIQATEKALAAWSDGNEPERLAKITKQLADESEITALSAQVDKFKVAADESRRLHQELKQVESMIVREETRAEGLVRIYSEWEQSGRQALAETRQHLMEKSFAAAEQVLLAELEVKLAATGHDESHLAAAKDKRARLASAPQEHQKLLQAEAAVRPLVDGLADLDAQITRLTARLAELATDTQETTVRLQDLEAGVGDLAAAEAELQRLRERVIALSRSAGGARQKVEVLSVRRADRQKLAAEKIALAQQTGLLRQLEEACGRKGVQAMLIERALPEIEDYANELLDRLTGGDMRVGFETQKAAKSKQDSLIETLDIRISDSTGERPYENYSGGEKFRINFAIRLALSQVLARRAGARLQTLVIDEGFGSQDPEGRQRLVEAINAVQDKFACILVITHIDELRDKFPARIDVEKTPTGSRLSVVTI